MSTASIVNCINAEEGYGRLPSCTVCSSEIRGDNFCKFEQRWYHVACFKCSQCNETANPERAKKRHDKILCCNCYGQMYWYKCELCSEPMDPKQSLQVNNRNFHFRCYKCNQCKQLMNPLNEQYLIDTEASIFCSIKCVNDRLATSRPTFNFKQ